MTTIKFQKRLFGTNGVRGVVGQDLTPELVSHIGEALGTIRNGTIAIGRDTRTSSEMLVMAVKSGLRAAGCNVVDCGILPTPALQYLVREYFEGGAMITASHNPPEYNGVKIIEPDGTEMGDEEVIILEQLVLEQNYSIKSWDQIGKEVSAHHLFEKYVHAIVTRFPQKPGKGMTVAVDPGSGPACQTTPQILKEMGCNVLTINGIMDGTFPGRMPEPSPDGLKNLSALVLSSGAAFGVAHDGDADRAVFIDENGHFVEENQELALIAQEICKNQKGILVTPVSTSQMVEIVAKQEGCVVTYTPVGSIYVARTMLSLIKEGKNVVFGGEGNGGLIFPDHQFCRDGGMTTAMMVSILSRTGQRLSTLINSLPKRHMIKDKIYTSQVSLLLEILKKAYSNDSIDLTDGIKIFKGTSWALIRPSGTEPLIRIVVEAESKKKAESIFNEVMRYSSSMNR